MVRTAALLSLLLFASAPVIAGGKPVKPVLVVEDAGTKEPIERARAELTENGQFIADQLQKREVDRCEALKGALKVDCSKTRVVLDGVFVGAITKPGEAGIVSFSVTSPVDGSKRRFALLFFRQDDKWGLFSEDFVAP